MNEETHNGKISISFAGSRSRIETPVEYTDQISTMNLNNNLGGLQEPFDPRFAASNPAEVDGLFSGRKNSEHKSSGKDFSHGSRVRDFRLFNYL